jgi:hypothetical protein
LAEHVCDTKHAIAWENSTIITTSNRYGQNVFYVEARHIKRIIFSMSRIFEKMIIVSEKLFAVLETMSGY